MLYPSSFFLFDKNYEKVLYILIFLIPVIKIFLLTLMILYPYNLHQMVMCQDPLVSSLLTPLGLNYYKSVILYLSDSLSPSKSVVSLNLAVYNTARQKLSIESINSS